MEQDVHKTWVIPKVVCRSHQVSGDRDGGRCYDDGGGGGGGDDDHDGADSRGVHRCVVSCSSMSGRGRSGANLGKHLRNGIQDPALLICTISSYTFADDTKFPLWNVRMDSPRQVDMS
mmetsp:Transcript_21178/g.31450  ORF Transcript_21178/g.31450 Transcript_21178/m.31450 type:complete len:118 (-) Transcript_21178:317-670(-)